MIISKNSQAHSRCVYRILGIHLQLIGRIWGMNKSVKKHLGRIYCYG